MDLNEIEQLKAVFFEKLSEIASAPDPLALNHLVDEGNVLAEALSELFAAYKNQQAVNAQLQSELAQQQTTNVQQLSEHLRLLSEYDSIVAENKELKRQLNQNSKNSSFSSSTDRPNATPKKNNSPKTNSGRSQGAQKNHAGAYLEPPPEVQVDERVDIPPSPCTNCVNREKCLLNRDQVYSIHDTKYQIETVVSVKRTQYRTLEIQDCPLHRRKGAIGIFPPWIKGRVQYGDDIAITATLLSVYGAMSLDRIAKLLSDWFGIPTLSPATILSMVKRTAHILSPAVQSIKERLQCQNLVHVDETGCSVAGVTFWIHNASNESYTFQTLSNKRGEEGIKQNGVIMNFRGRVVHDCWPAYWKFGEDGSIEHVVCNAHILRDLQGVIENEPEHNWALRMSILLRAALKVKKKLMGQGHKAPSELLLKSFLDQYDKIIHIANTECPSPPKEAKPKKGRQKKGKERSLIERLEKFKDSVCLFFKDFDVPFDNNQAERDIRNLKVKAKVSGCFRTEEGLQGYLIIRSYLSTAQKLGYNVSEALTQAYKGNADFIFTGKRL